MDDSEEAWNDQILTLTCPKTIGTYSTFSHESKLICTDPIYSKCNIPSRKLIENKRFPLNKCHQIYGFPIGFNLTRSPTLMISDAIPCNISPIVLPGQSGPVAFFYRDFVSDHGVDASNAGVRKRKAPSELWVRSVQSNDSPGKVSSKNAVRSCESKWLRLETSETIAELFGKAPNVAAAFRPSN